jgi:hypothetical protein
LIIVFFAFFGCAYEFAKCYIDKLENSEDDYENEDNSINNQNPNNQNQENKRNYEINNNGEKVYIWSRKEKLILTLVIIIGEICQPAYLMIYLLYALIECYRRFNCWFYYID